MKSGRRVREIRLIHSEDTSQKMSRTWRVHHLLATLLLYQLHTVSDLFILPDQINMASYYKAAERSLTGTVLPTWLDIQMRRLSLRWKLNSFTARLSESEDAACIFMDPLGFYQVNAFFVYNLSLSSYLRNLTVLRPPILCTSILQYTLKHKNSRRI